MSVMTVDKTIYVMRTVLEMGFSFHRNESIQDRFVVIKIKTFGLFECSIKSRYSTKFEKR